MTGRAVGLAADVQVIERARPGPVRVRAIAAFTEVQVLRRGGAAIAKARCPNHERRCSAGCSALERQPLLGQTLGYSVSIRSYIAAFGVPGASFLVFV